MSLANVRGSAVTALKTITFTDGKKLRADTYFTGSVNPPHAFFDFEIPEQLTFGTSVNACILVVQVLDQHDSPRGSQIRLDELRDPSNSAGMKQVLENGANWDATVDYCQFKNVSATEIVNVGGVDYLSVEFRFEVCV